MASFNRKVSYGYKTFVCMVVCILQYSVKIVHCVLQCCLTSEASGAEVVSGGEDVTVITSP